MADAVAQELRHAGHDVERKDAEHVHGFEGADAVVLGSPIYGGRWLEAGRRLLSNSGGGAIRAAGLAVQRRSARHPPTPDEPEPQELVQSATEIGAREHRVFSGRLDRSELGRGERLMVRAVHAPAGDFHDWEEIRLWARSIADALG